MELVQGQTLVSIAALLLIWNRRSSKKKKKVGQESIQNSVSFNSRKYKLDVPRIALKLGVKLMCATVSKVPIILNLLLKVLSHQK